MDEEVKTTPTWGYHKTKDPQIFHLKDGESLPRGWNDAPAAKPEEAEEPEEKGAEVVFPVVDEADGKDAS